MKPGNRVPVAEAQQALLHRYCADAGRAIANAPDAQTAKALRDELCTGFSRECESELVVNATRKYINRIIADRWGELDESDSPLPPPVDGVYAQVVKEKS